jgi:hypothetical protein
MGTSLRHCGKGNWYEPAGAPVLAFMSMIDTPHPHELGPVTWGPPCVLPPRSGSGELNFFMLKSPPWDGGKARRAI